MWAKFTVSLHFFIIKNKAKTYFDGLNSDMQAIFRPSDAVKLCTSCLPCNCWLWVTINVLKRWLLHWLHEWQFSGKEKKVMYTIFTKWRCGIRHKMVLLYSSVCPSVCSTLADRVEWKLVFCMQQVWEQVWELKVWNFSNS